MIRSEDFRPRFTAWMDRAGFSVRDYGDGRVTLAPQGGEIVYFLGSAPDGWIRVTSSSRGAAEAWEFDAATVEVVERYFTVDVGGTIRRAIGLPGDVRVPFLLEELAPGAEIKTLDDWEYSSVEELSLAGQPLARFRYLSGRVHLAVEASHYCSAPLAQVQASFLDPEGKPLFGLM